VSALFYVKLNEILKQLFGDCLEFSVDMWLSHFY